MAKRLPALTARDKTSVRKTARELRAAYDRGEEDSLSETVVISSGYADVEIYPDDEDTAYVVRHGVTTSVPMSARRKTRKRKVLHWSEYQSNHVPMTDAEFNRQADVYYAKTGVRLHRNPSRKRVPSKRVANPRGVRKDADSLYRIRREPLNAGGYTAGKFGQYFGRGEPLFAVETPDGDVLHVRGADRQDAMRNFREQYNYHDGGKHRTARFFGEKRKVANPARKRKPAAKRSWRVVVARDGRSLSVGSHVYEIVNATTRDGAMKAALKRHDSDARIVSLTEVG